MTRNHSNNDLLRLLGAALTAGSVALLAAPLGGCDRNDTPGEALDEAIDETGDALDEAGDDIQDAADDVADDIDDAADDVDDGVDDNAAG